MKYIQDPAKVLLEGMLEENSVFRIICILGRLFVTYPSTLVVVIGGGGGGGVVGAATSGATSVRTRVLVSEAFFTTGERAWISCITLRGRLLVFPN